MRTPFVLVSLATLAVVAACTVKPVPPPTGGGGKSVDAATAGAITGRVVFTGTPPPVQALRMATDPACLQNPNSNTRSDAVLISHTGALQNVFVYVKDGLDPAYSFAVPTAPIVMDQKGCRYTPRIFGVRVGQLVEIVNSDATLHNVHALPMANQEFNMGEPLQGMRMTRAFTAPEVMVRFKCDVHSWMTAYIGVMAHPFFAVTNADGVFTIKGLPPGAYTIDAWHEKFGTRETHVAIGEHETQAVSFSFAVK